MTIALPLIAASALAVAGQSADHARHAPPPHAAPPGQSAQPTAPSPATGPADPSCPPEHAAMGHCTPAVPAALDDTEHSQTGAVSTDPPCPPEHAAMGHCTPSLAAPAADPRGTALPAGDAPAPAPTEASYADRVWGTAAMAPARLQMRREHGGGSFSQIVFNLAEVQFGRGSEGFRWDGEGWFGGDLHRLVVKSEGAGAFGDGVDHAEVQALYSQAIGPYFNAQGGIRQDIGPGPSRTYLTVGLEGLAPYWFDVEAALFLSDRGELLARLEGYYDQRITQRLIAQPRAEANLAAQDVAGTDIGAGLSDVELGLRLRYEITRAFAPYVGVAWERSIGRSARLAREQGQDAGGGALLLGLRAWF